MQHQLLFHKIWDILQRKTAEVQKRELQLMEIEEEYNKLKQYF